MWAKSAPPGLNRVNLSAKKMCLQLPFYVATALSPSTALVFFIRPLFICICMSDEIIQQSASDLIHEK